MPVLSNPRHEPQGIVASIMVDQVARLQWRLSPSQSREWKVAREIDRLRRLRIC